MLLSEYADEPACSLLLYNQAVVYAQLKQYAAAARILEALFNHVEPIEEGTAMRICFLLLDVAYRIQRAGGRRGLEQVRSSSLPRLFGSHWPPPPGRNDYLLDYSD